MRRSTATTSSRQRPVSSAPRESAPSTTGACVICWLRRSCSVAADAEAVEWLIRQGLTFPEFADKHPQLYADFTSGRPVTIPGAESTPEVRQRMTAALQEAADAVDVGETGVVVGRGASLRVGVLGFLGLPDDFGDILAGMDNCAWAVLELRAGRGWQIVDYNARTLPEPVEIADDPQQ